MHASRKLKLLAIASLLLASQGSTAQPAQIAGTPTAPTEIILSTQGQGPDSIAESANQQRIARKREIANKLAASAQTAAPAVPAIQVNAIPQNGSGQAPGSPLEKNDQNMVLTEVLRSSIKSVAGISIFGSVRHVVAGDDLGNGWTVTDVGRFKVTLSETSGARKAGKGATRKTRTLLLGTQVAGARP